MEEIDNLVKKALDSGISSYYRKDAIRQLARINKSVVLSKAVVKLLNDIDDQSLQREVLDLAAKLANTEAINLIIPISIGKGNNARHAINVLAKIGGRQAYDSLRKIANAPGFDLSKTAASRAMEDMVRRHPELEKEDDASKLIAQAKDITQQTSTKVSEVISSIPVEIKETVNDITESANSAITQTVDGFSKLLKNQEESTARESKKPEKEKKTPEPIRESISVASKKEIASLTSQVEQYKRQVAEKDATISRLNDQVKALKKNSDFSKKEQELQRSLHQLKDNTARSKANYEKKIAVQDNKINNLEDDLENTRARMRKKPKKSESKMGCGTIILLIIMAFIVLNVLGKIF